MIRQVAAGYAGHLALDESRDTAVRRGNGEDPDPLLEPEPRWPVSFGWQPVAERKGSSKKDVWEVPELYVTGHRGARIVTAAIAIGIAVGSVFWVREARDRFDVPAILCDGCGPPDWFRWAQLLLAVVGIAAGIVVLVYMVNFVVRQYVWRRWRGVSLVFGVLAAAWTVLWWVDYFWI